jgi:hypothetical protein
MRVPRFARFRLHLRKPRARRRVGNAYQMLARRTLNLPPGELGFTFQRLVAVRTVKFEFISVHMLLPQYAQNRGKKYGGI